MQVPVVAIIDDDHSMRAATNCLLRSLGYRTHTFASAVEFLKSDHVDETSCVIADVQMPQVSGIELQSRLRARGRDLPIIFITAYPDDKIRARALEAGAVCFLDKPFDGDMLIRCLDMAMAPPSASRVLQDRPHRT